jgi:dihydroflavonol-4-reductase
MQTLVTGGSGFIGQYLVAALLQQGRRVRIVDVREPTQSPSEVEYLKGSVLDWATMQRAVKGVDEVYHLAALSGMWVPRPQDFHAVNCLGTEAVIAAVRESDVKRLLHCSTESILFTRSDEMRVVTEQIHATTDDMPGPYTRSKLMAEERAMQAAAAGLPVVVANPTIPIGIARCPTPPTLMLQHFIRRRIQLYLDFTLNIVDVRDVAAGLMLVMQRGRDGQRYLLGGENTSLQKLLGVVQGISGRRGVRVPISSEMAELGAIAFEFIADHVTRRPPSATLEGVRIARWSKPVSIEKSRRELGYSPHSIRPALEEAISSIINQSR